MSVQENIAQGTATNVLEKNLPVAQGVYASLFEKINLSPVSSLTGLDAFQNNDTMADATTDERVTAAVSVFLDLLKQSSKKVEKLNKTLLDSHIAALDDQISRQLDAVMHHPDFQRVESTWREIPY